MNPTGPQAVKLTNWGEGGDAFAAAFGKMLEPMFETLSKNQQVNGLPTASADSISPCPQCGGPRYAEVGDTPNLICWGCRNHGKPPEPGSLLELRVAIDSNQDGIDKLLYWPAMRHFGRSLWGPATFDAAKDPIALILDWLEAEHGRHRYDAIWMQRKEVCELMRAAVEGHKPPAAKSEQGEGNGVKAARQRKKRKHKADPKAKEKRAARQRRQKEDKRLSEAWAGGMGNTKRKPILPEQWT